ncbi:MAG: hypothetical protein R3F39_22825 [Myxococcota bacterium]
MGESTDELEVREAELFQREAALVAMEAQLHAQEAGLVEAERAFSTRTAALRDLSGYVEEQKANLTRRAESLGPKATRLVKSVLEQEVGGASAEPIAVGHRDEREVLLLRREELFEVRMQLVNEREAIFGRRHEQLDGAEARMAKLEEVLMTRELHMSQALRRLITSAAELSGPDDGAAVDATLPEGSEAVAPEAEASVRRVEGRGRRRRGRQHAWTTQVRFNLDAPMHGDHSHYFFVYGEDNGTGELPGVFVATPNLLKEDREVELQVSLVPDSPYQAKGIVAWRRSPGESGGPPGMGIELTWLEDGAREAIESWMSEHPPTEV